jgi:hypothetical protein
MMWNESQQALSVLPQDIEIYFGATQVFEVDGGASPYEFSVSAGAGTLVTSERSFSYTAPSVAESASIKIVDSSGAILYARFRVVEEPPPPPGPVPTTAVITRPAHSFIINQQTSDSFLVEGDCTENTRPVEILSGTTVLSIPICDSDRFIAYVDFTSVPDGVVTISTRHSSAQGEVAPVSSVTGTKDTVAPTMPGNFVSGVVTTHGSNSPTSSWMASTDIGGSGVDFYELRVGTTPTGEEIKYWSSVGRVLSASLTNLNLAGSTNYYTAIRARDVAGNVSDEVISPAWTFIPPPFTSATAGGDGDDLVENITMDGAGNVLLSFAVKNDAADSRIAKDFAGQSIAPPIGREQVNQYVIKLNSSGQQVWAKRIGTSTDCAQAWPDAIHSLIADAAGNVFVGGYLSRDAGCVPKDFAGNDLPDTRSTFVAKLDSAGNQLWFKTMGGGNFEFGTNAMYIDSDGNVIAAGPYANGPDDSNHVKDFNNSTLLGQGGRNFFLAKLSGIDGSQSWIKFFGGTSIFAALNVMTIVGDSSNNYFVGGAFDNSSGNERNMVDFAGQALLGRFPTSNLHGVVFKVNTSGSQQWVKTFGGDTAATTTMGNLVYNMAVNAEDDLYLTGAYFSDASNSTGSVDFTGTAMPGQGPTPTTDAYLIKLSNSGVQQWIKTFGGNAEDYGVGVQVAADGKILLAGTFTNDSANGMSVIDVGNSTLTGKGSNSYNMFLSLLDSAGGFLYTRVAGGSGEATAHSLAMRGSNAFVSGKFGANSATDFMNQPISRTCVNCTERLDGFIGKLEF